MWTNPIPLFISFNMKKNSPLTPFITYELIRMFEVGVKGIIYQRHRIAEPNCKPIQIPTISLGIQKASFLFLLLFFGFVFALIVFGFEHVWIRKVPIKPMTIEKDESKSELKNVIMNMQQFASMLNEDGNDGNLHVDYKYTLHFRKHELLLLKRCK